MFDKKELAKKLKLYLICGEGETPRSLADKVDSALEGGVTAVQLRVKSWTSREIYDAARVLAQMAKRRGALFIVNDRLDIALACGADGVHLGQKDLPADAARRIAPAGFIIGGTARTRELAEDAERRGVDYIGCGSAFATKTKDDAVVIGPASIKNVLDAVALPSVAIGGITAQNLHLLSGCGCSGVALAAEIMASDDPGRRSAELIREIDRTLPGGKE